MLEYKQAEEQGLILKLPCKVGDTVYTLNTLPSGKTIIGEVVICVNFARILQRVTKSVPN